MTVQQEREGIPALAETFVTAMTRLVSGVAVVTARTAARRPCGLLVSSLCSYSIRPPSVLFALDRASRSYPAVVQSSAFGVHVLGRQQDAIARTFAGKGDEKFADLAWEWDGSVPRIPHVPVYLLCETVRVFRHGDHAIVIGNVAGLRTRAGDPLVYFQRDLSWRLAPASCRESVG